MNIRCIILLISFAVSLHADINNIDDSGLIVFKVTPSQDKQLRYVATFLTGNSSDEVVVMYSLIWHPVTGDHSGRILRSSTFLVSMGNYRSIVKYLSANKDKLIPQSSARAELEDNSQFKIAVGIANKNEKVTSYVILNLAESELNELLELINSRIFVGLIKEYDEEFQRLLPEFKELINGIIAERFSRKQNK